MGGRGVFVYLGGEIQFSETVPGRLGQGFQAGISGPEKTRGMGQYTMQLGSLVTGGRQSQRGWAGPSQKAFCLPAKESEQLGYILKAMRTAGESH